MCIRDSGKPLLGIASHMDQHLSMSYVEKAGVGTLLRSEELTSTKLRETVHQLLANDLAPVSYTHLDVYKRQVVGDTINGRIIHFQVFYHLCEFLSGRRTLGLAPGFGGARLDIVPADYVAQVIALSLIHI